MKNRDDYLNMNNYLDWILAILSNDKIAEDIFEDYTSNDLSDFAKILVFEEENSYKQRELADISKIIDGNSKNSLYEKFKEIYTNPYPYQADTVESIKKSVTEISKNFNPEEDGYELPAYNPYKTFTEFRKANFISEETEYKATDIGTIIHKLFQGLDYKDYNEKSLARAIDRLIIENKIKKDELRVVDQAKILSYFNHPLIKKIYKNSTNLRKEESFLMKYEDYYVNGQIDLIFENDNDIILLDFKTDAIKRDGLYNQQLRIYKKAIEESLNKPVVHSFIYLSLIHI